ncbi:putative catalytic [Corchorus olitorius]|uniref:Catalytic n=1 Tax=Corchorus olitorius TaxID=93759 RepID=A0A1R3I942_9ROSI|nr:putative catalytic [Corchorus olitorius]
MYKGITLLLLIGLLAWAYQAILPPPPKICGSPGGPPVTATRIKLRDGRHLAYRELGVSKEIAKHKFIFVHGFSSCRHDEVIVSRLSPEVVEELGVYSLSFDKPGYGESDPDPRRTMKSLTLDIEELADQLGLGSKFYVIGYSMGGHAVWGCLKYIPHRLAGAALLAPVINYWWPGFPANLSTEAYRLQLPQDQWALRVAHYLPFLVYWWNTQKFFPGSGVAARRPEIYSHQDTQLLHKLAYRQNHKGVATQQGEFESLHRDMRVGFGKWEFDPLDLENPFPSNEANIHLWMGDEDRFVPVMLQRYIAKKLSWIQYHELQGAGHLFGYADGMSEAIVRALLVGHK